MDTVILRATMAYQEQNPVFFRLCDIPRWKGYAAHIDAPTHRQVQMRFAARKPYGAADPQLR
jgi:hypothetical protein